MFLISGKLHAGKNTVADMIQELLTDYTVQQMSLAEPLKNMCKKSFEPLTKYLNDTLDECAFPDQPMNNDEIWFEKKNDISRLILQIVGTDIIRNHIDKNYWVNILVDRINDYFEDGSNRVVICNDIRFLNEIDIGASSNETIYKIRINRQNEASIGQDHISESELDKYDAWDFIIDNCGTLDLLKMNVVNMLKEFKMVKE